MNKKYVVNGILKWLNRPILPEKLRYLGMITAGLVGALFLINVNYLLASSLVLGTYLWIMIRAAFFNRGWFGERIYSNIVIPICLSTGFVTTGVPSLLAFAVATLFFIISCVVK